MNCIESPKGRKSPVLWKKRQSIRDFIKQKPMFNQLMQQSKTCMRLHPELRNNVKGAIACETIHPLTLTPFNNFTFHTHPHNIPYPSQTDKNTTKKLNKEYLLIGVVPQQKVYAFHVKDNFEKAVSVF